jgi:hypothetical protein
MLRRTYLALALVTIFFFSRGSRSEDALSFGDVPDDSVQSFSSALHEVVAAGRLPDLRWPDFSDFRLDMEKYYDSVGYSPAWLIGNKATPQALTMIAALKQADGKGLSAEDYDGSRWDDRVTRLLQSPSPADQARFDAALTICAMRYISALHMGRVNPRCLRTGCMKRNSSCNDCGRESGLIITRRFG